MKKIVILIPAYNEEEVLDALYLRLKGVIDKIDRYDFELLFVNDGSRDDTLKILKRLRQTDSRISYVSLSRNFGKEIAMAAGIEYADGDALVIIDADLQDPPELIKLMIEEWEKGFEDIYAKRRSREGESFIKKTTSVLFYKFLSAISDVPIQKDTGDFRLLDKRCVDALKQFKENQRYTKGMFSLIGFKKKELLFDRDAREAGTTKWNYIKLFDLAIKGITSFTTKPLRIASLFGGICTLFAVLFMMVVIIKKIFWGDPAVGYPSLLSAIIFLGGLQLLSIGIIGEYIGIIFNETKRRPMYIVDEYEGKENSI